MKQYLLALTLFCLLFVQEACQTGRLESSKSEIPSVQVNFIRFEKLLGAVTSQAELDRLIDRYPDFSALFFKEVASINTLETASNVKIDSLKSFFADPFIEHLSDTVDHTFKDLEFLKEELSEALGRMKLQFEMDSVLYVYSFVSGMSYQRFLFSDKGRDALAVGLDLYIGGNYPYHLIDPNNPSFSRYLSRTFNKAHMAKKSLELFIDDRMLPLRDSRLLDLMVQNGLKLYLLHEFLPATADTIIYEYSESQLDWCTKNEAGIWAYLLDQELLYERDMRKISKYVLPSPNSPGMPEDAPGQTANFIGSKIVSSYMRRFPQTSFEELMVICQDAQQFLESSHYKPARQVE